MKQILKKINELNKIEQVETKGKRLIESQKKLLTFFDDLLKTIFNERDRDRDRQRERDRQTDRQRQRQRQRQRVNENKNESDDGQHYLKQQKGITFLNKYMVNM